MATLDFSRVPLPEEVLAANRWLDELLLKQPGTVKEFNPAWQAYKYMLRDKMYAYIGMNDKICRPILTLKLEPAFSELLRSQHEDIVPGYYMNKIHWSTVYLDSTVPDELLADIVVSSYKELLSSLSKKAQLEIMEGSLT